MRESSRRPQATPSARRALQRLRRRSTDRLQRSRDEILAELGELAASIHPRNISNYFGFRGLRLLVNVGVALLVLSLPLAATAATGSAPSEPAIALAAPALDAPRAQAISRGGTISAGRAPVTVLAPGVRPIIEQKLGPDDTLATMANFYGVSPEAIAYANGITDPVHLELGRSLRIPPADGALYTVAEGDTVASVAERFKVDPAVIEDYNRLYFEPEHFQPGQLVFVPGATLPGLVYATVEPEPEPAPTVIARVAPAPVLAPARSGRLAWPVGGVITQYFWYGHTGVDVAAPYGTGIGASDAGVVSATGWVAVGGLRVCVRHSGGLETCYYHTGAVFVTPGQAVARGQIIASIGLTGVTTGPHVHWECRLNGSLVNCLGL